MFNKFLNIFSSKKNNEAIENDNNEDLSDIDYNEEDVDFFVQKSVSALIQEIYPKFVSEKEIPSSEKVNLMIKKLAIELNREFYSVEADEILKKIGVTLNIPIKNSKVTNLFETSIDNSLIQLSHSKFF